MFGVGYELDTSGKREAAETIYQQTIELLEELSTANAGKLSESKLASLAYGHGKSLVKLGRTRPAIAAFRRAIEILEGLLGRGVNSILFEQRASAYAWLGLAQRKSGVLKEACENYEHAIELWQQLPGVLGAHVNPYDGLLGATYLGYSRALAKLGEDERSSEALQLAQDLLQEEFKILSGTRH